MELTDRQKEVYDCYHKNNCSEKHSMRELGISKMALRSHLFLCTRKGYPVTPNRFIPQAPAGFGLDKSTIQVNAEGEIVQRWDRVSPLSTDLEQIRSYLGSRVSPVQFSIPRPTAVNKNLMLEFLLYDLHLSMHSWAKQTGAAYDTDIARSLMIRAAERIYAQCGRVAESVIILGGDNFHTDNRANVTEKSKHHLDVDTRYQRSIEALTEAAVTAIDIALIQSGRVKVVVLSGNHDYHSAVALSLILGAYYRDNDRVEIDTSPSKHKFHRFGSNYFLYTHGDTGTDKRLAGYLLNHLVDHDITGIRRKYVRKGHLHKRGRAVVPGIIEEDGVVIEMFPTLAAPDAFAHEQAYSQMRATAYNLWHERYGKRAGGEVCVGELCEAA